jgi:hypothetical protein
MAISDVYTAHVANVAVAATTSTAILSLWGTATKRLWVVGVRVDVVQTTAAAPNNSLFTLARSNTTATGTSTSTGNPHDFSAPASLGIIATTWSTAPTFTTGTLWEQELPQTTGSSWEEFPPLGYEWGVPAIANGSANGGVHVFVTQSVATSTTYTVDLVWSE